MLILTNLKHSIDLPVAFSEVSTVISSVTLGISEKCKVITSKSQKTEFDKYATGGVSAFSIPSIYVIQFTIDQNCLNITSVKNRQLN